MISSEAISEIQLIVDACGNKASRKKWDRNWSAGGCYLHLECSKFIESLRGKGGLPHEEAADVLFVLFSMMDKNKVSLLDVLSYLENDVLLEVKE